MVASVHDYCVFKLFSNRAHSPQKEYRFLCAHVPSSTIPHFLLPASYIVLLESEIKQRSLICEEASKCLLKYEVSKCQLKSSSLTQEMMFLLKFEEF